MAKKQVQEETPAGAPAWMATYGDLVTNLLCFFVLLFSFSSIDQTKFHQLMMSFQNSNGVFTGQPSVFEQNQVFDGRPEKIDTEAEENNEADLEKFKKQLDEYQEEHNLDLNIKYRDDGRGLLISFSDKILFDSGKAILKEQSLPSLDFVSKALSSPDFVDRLVRIDGHTDNIPIGSNLYKTNWELSTARATNVLRYFIEVKGLNPRRFIASGYGEFRPIESNDTEEGRSQNRRVDIVVLSKKSQKSEPHSGRDE